MDELRDKVAIVRRRGGWFVTGESWSGPWGTEEAASLAMAGQYAEARRAERNKL